MDPRQTLDFAACLERIKNGAPLEEEIVKLKEESNVNPAEAWGIVRDKNNKTLWQAVIDTDDGKIVEDFVKYTNHQRNNDQMTPPLTDVWNDSIRSAIENNKWNSFSILLKKNPLLRMNLNETLNGFLVRAIQANNSVQLAGLLEHLKMNGYDGDKLKEIINFEEHHRIVLSEVLGAFYSSNILFYNKQRSSGTVESVPSSPQELEFRSSIALLIQNHWDYKQSSLLNRAIEKGDFSFVKYLVEEQWWDVNAVPADSRNQYNVSPLALALGNTAYASDIVVYLLGKDVKVDWSVDYDPLTIAFKNKNKELALTLIDYLQKEKPDLFKTLLTSKPYLAYAVERQMNEVVDKLLALNAPADQQGDSIDQAPGHRVPFVSTPLYRAVEKADQETVKKLLEKGAQPYISEEGYASFFPTPFLKAVELGQVTIAQQMLEHLPSIDNAEVKNLALYKAVHAQQVEMVKFLIGKGFDVNGRSVNSATPLLELVEVYGGKAQADSVTSEEEQNNLDILLALIKAGADVSLKKESQIRTPLQQEHAYIPNKNTFRSTLILAEIYAKVKNKPLAQQVETILTADLVNGYGTSLAADTHAKKPPVDAELLQTIKAMKGDPTKIDDYLKSDAAKTIDPAQKWFIEEMVLAAPGVRDLNAQRAERRERPFYHKDRMWAERVVDEKASESKIKTTEDAINDIKQDLRNYIIRVEGYGEDKANPDNKTINFREGFWFMKDSRAKNRQANYKLARDLLLELENGKPLNQVFDPDNIKYLRRDFDPTRNIHSAELNRIIRAAEQIIAKKPPTPRA